MSVPAAPDRLRSVRVPVDLVIPWQKKHYFTHTRRTAFTRRAFSFWGEPALLPLVRAFLNGCAADRDAEYRHLFTLLGSELAANAIRHTRSGHPGGVYTLRADRSVHGLTLTCRDDGALDGRIYDHRERHHLPAPRRDADPLAEDGRGLLLIDAFATAWGDCGRPSHRQVWFHLAYDLTNSSWPLT